MYVTEPQQIQEVVCFIDFGSIFYERRHTQSFFTKGSLYLIVASKEHYNFNGQNGIKSKQYRYPPKKIPINCSHYRNRGQFAKYCQFRRDFERLRD